MNHAYLSGFYAEKYDQEPEQVFPIAADRSINSSKDLLRNDATGYTTKNIVSNSLVADEKERYYALLPVWMVNVKYKDKMHIFAMNGQTGEFIGNIPLNVPKTIIYFTVIFLIVFAIILLISFIVWMGAA